MSCHACNFLLRKIFLAFLQQRTHRQPKDRNVAETNPQAFAELLIEKLKKVEQKQEKDERLRASMSRVFDEVIFTLKSFLKQADNLSNLASSIKFSFVLS